MIYILFGLIGAAAGRVYFYGQGGFLLGAVTGLLLAAVINLRNRLMAMELRLKALEATYAGAKASPAASDPEPAGHDVASLQSPAAGAVDASDAEEGKKEPIETIGQPPRPVDDLPSLELELADASTDRVEPGPTTGSPSADQLPSAPAGTGNPIQRWLLGGNIVVRVGVVVLLFGFAFLVKYAASRNLIPLEVRLAAAFAAGAGMLILGWRLKDSRFAYAVTLQGGGIGVMYLTLFASTRLFHLVPLPLTFGLLLGLVVFSGALAVLQNAAAMAVIGAAGGFMAPVLLSTGTGSHVMLFSYYGLLNAGIFGIAWFKTWRWLNLLGFIFTFGIGSAWGLQYYRPAFFSSTEPFLVLFFLFYLIIAVLFALRQPPRLKGYVDGTLVFGMPLVVFSLQVGLVKAMPYGLAFSAVTLGLIYAGLATMLWKRHENGLRTLVEAFLALGVIFGSLAIPLALSGSWTAVTWGLEGAGLVWIGLRQHRCPARIFGLLLQIGSGVLFMMEGHSGSHPVFIINSRFLGGMMIGLAGLFCAFMLERHQKRLYPLERTLTPMVLSWGLIWWFATGIIELDRYLSRRFEWPGWLSYAGISALAMGLCYRWLNWKGMRFPAMGFLPAMMIAGVVISNHYFVRHPFQGGWSVVWPVLFAVHAYLLDVLKAAWPGKITVTWHTLGALLATFLLSWEAGWLLDRLAGGAMVWAFIAWGGIPALILWGLMRYGRRVRWPAESWEHAYRAWLPALLATGLLVWSVWGTFLSGEPKPLPYLPLLNPLDLVQTFVFLVLINWVVDVGRKTIVLPTEIEPAWLWGTTAACMLLWLTTAAARCIHVFGQVPYDWDMIWRSDMFHAAVAVLWGVLALVCMVASNRLQHRVIWFSGAGLLTIVVIKLFMVDLSGSGTISRIVSFLAVGALMLVIGFFTPLPPTASKGSHS